MNKHIGSSLDALLMDENVLEETTAKAMKSVVAMTIKQGLEAKKISKAELAKKMHTSRAAVYRLLDPDNTSVSLSSIVKVMGVLGKKVEFSIACNNQ